MAVSFEAFRKLKSMCLHLNNCCVWLCIVPTDYYPLHKHYMIVVEIQRDPWVTATQMCRKWKKQANTKTGKTARQTILWISGVKWTEWRLLKRFERGSQHFGSLTVTKGPITDLQPFNMLYFKLQSLICVNFSVNLWGHSSFAKNKMKVSTSLQRMSIHLAYQF